jgi:hypothetical protein
VSLTIRFVDNVRPNMNIASAFIPGDLVRDRGAGELGDVEEETTAGIVTAVTGPGAIRSPASSGHGGPGRDPHWLTV